MAVILSVMFMGTGPPGARLRSTGLIFLFSLKMTLFFAFITAWEVFK